MRTIGAIIVIVLGSIPAVLAGFPQLAPAWFADRLYGVPQSVVAMAALMAAFVALAGIFAGAKASKTVEGGQ